MISLTGCGTHMMTEEIQFRWNVVNKTYEMGVRKVINNTERGEWPKHWSEKIIRADLDEDTYNEVYSLKENTMTVTENNETVWTSPPSWKIHDFSLDDATRDEKVDINISAWRDSNYGSSQPFWETENDTTQRDHFFVMKYTDNTVKAVWQSSNLESLNQEFILADVDGDTKKELIVIENDYSESRLCHNNYVAVWKWNEWWFVNIWRSEKGNYCYLRTIENTIIVEKYSYSMK